MSKKLLVMALVITLAGAGMAYGAWVSTDTFVISFTPTGNRGVVIDTATISAGDLTVGQTWESEAIPTVSTGNVSGIEYTIEASISATDPATLSADTTPESTEICLQGLFNTVKGGTMDADDVVTTAPQQVGNKDNDAGDPGFEGDVEMDDMGLYQTRNLWMKITMPPDTIDYSGQQNISVIVNAQAAD